MKSVLLRLAGVLLLAPLSAPIAQAQVLPITPAADGTGTTVTPHGNRFDIGGGRSSRDGANLFQSFDRFGLNQGEVANFLSPAAVRNILGRVVGGDPSIINGLLQVTGGTANLYLVNPAGIVFGANASLNVPASFTATTANGIEFGSGQWLNAIGAADYATLIGTPGAFGFTSTQPGAIVNLGNLAVGQGQSLTLLGGTILNTGQLTAPGGQITIAAVPGQTLVRLSQQGSLLSLEFSPLSANASLSDSSTPPTLPQLLTGGNLGNATGVTVNPDGTLQLTGSTMQTAAKPGTAIVSGQVSVASSASPASPAAFAQIAVLGDRVSLQSATLDASGLNGGTVRIGGGYQGQGTVPNARFTDIDAGTVIHADAIAPSASRTGAIGNGGTVIVWSGDTTHFAGTITAQGSSNGGNGGLVETSGKTLTVAPSAKVSTYAPLGQTGTWLLDPTDLTVVGTGGTAAITGGTNTPAAASTINAGTIVTALNGSNVNLQATNSITVNAAINASGNMLPGNLALTTPTTTFNQPITLAAGSNLSGTATTANVNSGAIIQNGVDVAAAGATVNVAAGTFNVMGATDQVTINKSLTVRGAGAGRTIVDGGSASRGFNLALGASDTVTLDSLTIRSANTIGNGAGILVNTGSLNLTNSTLSGNTARLGASGTGGGGGGIYNGSGTVSVTNSTIGGNAAANNGGGIYSGGGTVSVTNSTISGNAAANDGGGIANDNTNARAIVNVTDSIIAGNAASDSGGGIYSSGDTIESQVVTVTNSTISGNAANNGGGILSDFGTAIVTNSTISGNAATNNGGGIYISNDIANDTVSITNSTFSGNTATIGGGIYNSGTVTVSNSTISGNVATSGGGIYNDSYGFVNLVSSTLSGNTAGSNGGGGLFNAPVNSNTTVKIANTIVAGNTSPTGPDVSGTVNSQGFNLVGNTSGGSGFVSTDLLNVNPRLAPLANNGGSTQTLALLPGSPAIDAGNNSLARDANGNPLTTDQRGFNRIANQRVDIGAYESGARDLQPTPQPTSQPNLPESVRRAVQQDPTPTDPAPPKLLTDVGQVAVFDRADAIQAQLESSLTAQFAAYLNLEDPHPLESLPEIQHSLHKIETATGIKPALFYISLLSRSIDTDTGRNENKQPELSYDSVTGNPVIRQVPSMEPDLVLILVPPSGSPILRRVAGVTRTNVLNLALTFRNEVADPSKTLTQSYLPSAQQLYSWLIAPMEAELKAQGINTLMFAMDTNLRFLPLAALHDGKQFLVEKYSIGLLPSVSLSDLRLGDVRDAQVLAAGASTFADPKQAPLPGVKLELATILAIDRSTSRPVLDADFTRSHLQKLRRDKPFGIIHLATHGEFLPGTIRQSYIQFSDGQLRLNQIRTLGWGTTPPAELVVLSACQMALGNEDAELGFAGFAVKAGVKTALASLWNISDEGTIGFMSRFYEELRREPTKAGALRQAQIAMLKGQVRVQQGQLTYGNGTVTLPSALAKLSHQTFSHPYYWSAFTMIGSPW